MSVFKNIKSLFVVEEATPQGKKKTSSSVKTTSSESVPSATVSESNLGSKGKITSKFMDVLFSAMEKANLEGFDYLEYKQSLKSLEKMPMDEATRYQSAFAMAQTMGATPTHLVTSAGHYVKVLQQEEKKFEAALTKQRDQNIGGRKKEITDLNGVIKKNEEAIQKLQKEIEQAKKKQQALAKEVEKASTKVESTKNNFIASYNQLVAQIQKDMEAMKQYLK